MTAHPVPSARSLLCRVGWHRWLIAVTGRLYCARPGCDAYDWEEP